MLKIKEILFPSTGVTHDELLLSFKQHYLQEQGFVRSSIYWMINSNEVDDLIQETFLKAWKNFKNFEAKSSFRTWIYRIAMNVTYDYLKKNKKQLEELHVEKIQGESVNTELSDLISKGLMLLSTEKREAFTLHYQIGLTYVEVSKLLNIPEGTVKSRVNKAKIFFIKFLKENGVNNG